MMRRAIKRISIITLQGYYNYGNRLQNYALQEVIKNFSEEVETLILPKASVQSSETFNKIKKVFSYTLSQTLNSINNKINSYINKSIIDQRENKFKQFAQKYINEKHINSFDELRKIAKDTDYFVVGSDQVWHPYNMDQYYSLQFVEEEKRIAYAPSFGISEIPEDVKPQYKEWLSSIPYISVREKEGAKIIKQLTGRDAPVLVDPTLLLTKDEWLKISKVHAYKPSSKYLISYFWGKIPTERKTLIKQIAKKYNLEIVSIADLKDKKTYIADPSEFIDYIDSASLVLTDSYHGTIFSILMETPFFVFERTGGKSMYSRIETLLELTELSGREEKDIDLNKDILNIDFSHVKGILEKEREKSFDFLSNAMKIEKNK